MGGTACARRAISRTARAYRAVDRCLSRLVCRGRPDLCARCDLRSLGCEVLSRLPDDVDLLVDVTGAAGEAPWAQRSTAPVWWFDHDGHAVWPQGVAGYAEVLRGRPMTCCRLMGRLSGRSEPVVLRRATFATHPLFGAENRLQLLWKSIPLITQKVRELQVTGQVACEERERGDDSAVERGDDSAVEWGRDVLAGGSLTATVRLLALLARHVVSVVRFVSRRLGWRDQWFLLVDLDARPGASRVSRMEALRTPAAAAPRLLLPPADRYWADPHVVPSKDGRYVLVEEYPYGTHLGRIAMLSLSSDGSVSEARTVLEEGYHLSYPCVFAQGGELYMAPEASEVARVDAYRCAAFPWRWERVGTLLDGVRACDASIIEYAGRWWLFATVIDESWLIPRDSLNVYFSDDPVKGPWQPHPGNPVVCDASRARPAGALFVSDGRLYRPGQDCTGGYGRGIRIHEVITLTDTRYQEAEVAFIEPAWGKEIVATHTLALGDDVGVVDVMRWLPRWTRSR